ncbi:hypothetical protein K435DRAFT_854790 [Dendrothele bispora CBS 962.96]|uniref:CCHC-type domain-containing protein n=1 Tax=Dendrothele bispora (strain CBS 962.96) TaxID=1314807 RepID=A0A4V4HGW6_DENBC|nr:hypothetical protein K435DRAFT_854790 [Dendrothele bispora CBS 962.96]
MNQYISGHGHPKIGNFNVTDVTHNYPSVTPPGRDTSLSPTLSPSSSCTQTCTLSSTPVYSTSPTPEEYLFKSNCAKVIIEAYVNDITSFIPDVDTKSAKQTLKQFDKDFMAKDELIRIETDRKLHSIQYTETNTLEQFFKDLHELQKRAIDVGNQTVASDSEFRSIILVAFPGEVSDTIIHNITTSASFTTSSSKGTATAGNQLMAEADAAVLAKVVELERKVAAQAERLSKSKSDKKCSNCSKLGHLEDDCFRKGGGKEGLGSSYHAALSAVANFSKTSSINNMSVVRKDFLAYTPIKESGLLLRKETQFIIVGIGKA